MIKSGGKIIVFLAIIFYFAHCAPSPPRVGLEPPDTKWIKKTLQRLSLEEKVAQMICCRFRGQYLHRGSDEEARLVKLVREQKIGGLILFGGQVYETAILNNKLQEAASIPLLIASDLERGLGNQLDGATLFPPLMSLGAINSEELAYEMGRVTAIEARAVGIHMTYAPVVDVNINPENPIINTRSFGEDPQLVGRLAQAFIRGCQEHGLIATAKHFPGHGDTAEDSHSVLPRVEGDLARLEQVELYPFRQAIAAGVKAIMTAHIYLPALEPTPNLPATLSPRILTDLLRQKLGFRGLIVTDAMGMGGITRQYDTAEAAVRAVKAGVDMLLLPPEPEVALKAVVVAVERGEISETRINSAVRRILAAKASLGLHRQKLVELSDIDRIIASPEHLDIARQTFEKSITCVKNEGKVLPLDKETAKIGIWTLSSDPGGYFAGETFIRAIKKITQPVKVFRADAFTGQEFIDQALAELGETQVVVIGVFSRLRAGKGNVDLQPRFVELIKKLAAQAKPVVIISFGSPYFLRHFPEVDVYLCAYRYANEAQQAAARALFGEIPLVGRLPVSIPGCFPRGHGLIVPQRD
jgi:beta-glucosidase-like glycosyl hydrolase